MNRKDINVKSESEMKETGMANAREKKKEKQPIRKGNSNTSRY
jgi:hypothetical protein